MQYACVYAVCIAIVSIRSSTPNRTQHCWTAYLARQLSTKMIIIVILESEMSCEMDLEYLHVGVEHTTKMRIKTENKTKHSKMNNFSCGNYNKLYTRIRININCNCVCMCVYVLVRVYWWRHNWIFHFHHEIPSTFFLILHVSNENQMHNAVAVWSYFFLFYFLFIPRVRSFVTAVCLSFDRTCLMSICMVNICMSPHLTALKKKTANGNNKTKRKEHNGYSTQHSCQ